MREHLFRGVLIGFSGGADSVLLLLLLSELKRKEKDYKILAFHVNHLIRGAEAFRDESFAKEFAEGIDVEFQYARLDVPEFAKASGKGLEEAAREIRYSEFNNIILGRNDISTIATAHNSTDNLETVILNMMRGAGSRGLSGILPVRDNIVRPLIYVSKKEVVDFLSECEIPFVVDSTNLTSDYKRNYVRQNILPSLSPLAPSPEDMALRVSENLRRDADYIDSVSDEFISENYLNGSVSRKTLLSLHPALFARVILKLAKSASGVSAESTHVNAVLSHLPFGDFSLSFPGGISFVASGDVCSFKLKTDTTTPSYSKRLTEGINEIDGFDGVILLSKTPFDNSFRNVFKISTQVKVDSAIIDGDLYVRTKEDGDAYKSGGITRKLKKLFNDRNVPKEYRFTVPVICDGQGIIWVPGLNVRDGGDKNSPKTLFLALAYKTDTKEKQKYELRSL
jgi:tRNA(Ile)-lysidine synthase